eukprot:c20372_g1_i1.p1 GENE.c20372_g1_i1~~c20372_g1_i1.p1  ORF type:complete len:101 (-),score=24.95 c20372_g1_i1:219-521(-)
MANLKGAHGIIYVLDSTKEPQELALQINQIRAMMSNSGLLGKPMLIFNNKKDDPGFLDSSQVSSKLALGASHRAVNLQDCTMLDDASGVQEGLEWLVKSC